MVATLVQTTLGIVSIVQWSGLFFSRLQKTILRFRSDSRPSSSQITFATVICHCTVPERVIGIWIWGRREFGLISSAHVDLSQASAVHRLFLKCTITIVLYCIVLYCVFAKIQGTARGKRLPVVVDYRVFYFITRKTGLQNPRFEK